MANQITIDIGAAANDGTGDPLRTAFNYVNNNFSNVWNTGLPNSNVQFSDNRILTVNTNANLVLAPNGIAKVVSNVSIVPNMSNVHSIGGSDRRWNTIYAQYLDISNDIAFGDLTVDGNLTVTGNIIEIGNIVTDSKTIQLANTASTANAANGSGITVGANDNIATLLYNSTSNVWTTNIGLSATGNVTGNYILGNGALLTGLAATYGNSNVAAYLPTYTGNLSAGNAAITNLTSSNLVNGRTGTFTGDQFSDGAMYVGTPAGTVLGSDVVIQITANSGSYSQTNFQNINSGVRASSDYILTANNGNNTSRYLDLGITSSGWDGSETNVLANLVANNGYLYVQDGNLTVGTRNGNVSYGWNFDTTGNLTAPRNISAVGNITGNYILGNGSQLTGLAATYGNANVVANLAALGSNPVSTTGNVTAGNLLFGTGIVSGTGNITGGNVSTGVITLTNGAVIKDTAGDAVAFGQNAGQSSQGDNSVAVGTQAGQITQGQFAVAIGDNAGNNAQGTDAVAIGASAGLNTQGNGAVALGQGTGETSQGANAVALGKAAGQVNQGINSVAIGQSAGLTDQGNNSIILNATGSALDQTIANTFTVAPVRNDVANTAEVMFYNATSKEVTYGNVISVAGNITGGNLTVGSGTITGGNVNGSIFNGNVAFGTGTVGGSGNITGGNISAIGNIASGNLSVTGNITGNTGGFAIGYRDIPQVSLSSNVTTALTDAGKHYYSVSASNLALTIANNSSVVWPVGAAISIVNRGTANITIAGGTGVSLYLAGNATAGNRTVTTYGMATVMNVAANIWMISGTVV